MQLKNHLPTQQATALITALFIMALVAIAATAMSVRLQIDIRRTELTTNAEKLYHVAQGTQYWAISVLTQTINKNNMHKLKQTRVDQLPQQFTDKKQDGVLISGRLLDAQARFNINNLSQVKYYATFQRLLAAVAPTLSKQQRQHITAAIGNWVSINKTKQSSQFDLSYLRKKPPYQSAHQFMASISELRLIDGIDAKLYQQLQPYVIALPQITAINVNSAAKPVLMSLGFSEQQAEQLIASRKQTKGFNDLTAWQRHIDQFPKQQMVKDANITLSSDFFIVQVNARQKHQSLNLYSLLQRSIINNKVKLAIRWQSQGTL